MITIEQHVATRQKMLRTMAKFMRTFFQSSGHQDRTVRDAAQRKDDRLAGRSSQFFSQKLITNSDFGYLRLVLRRQTFHRIGDAAIDQFHAVVGSD